MGLPDMSEFDAENRPVFNRRKLDIIMEQLAADDPDRLSALQAAMADRAYTSAAIGRVLRSWGFDITEDSVQSYRRDHG